MTQQRLVKAAQLHLQWPQRLQGAKLRLGGQTRQRRQRGGRSPPIAQQRTACCDLLCIVAAASLIADQAAGAAGEPFLQKRKRAARPSVRSPPCLHHRAVQPAKPLWNKRYRRPSRQRPTLPPRPPRTPPAGRGFGCPSIWLPTSATMLLAQLPDELLINVFERLDLKER